MSPVLATFPLFQQPLNALDLLLGVKLPIRQKAGPLVFILGLIDSPMDAGGILT